MTLIIHELRKDNRGKWEQIEGTSQHNLWIIISTIIPWIRLVHNECISIKKISILHVHAEEYNLLQFHSNFFRITIRNKSWLYHRRGARVFRSKGECKTVNSEVNSSVSKDWWLHNWREPCLRRRISVDTIHCLKLPAPCITSVATSRSTA